jgi:uncharacterized protein (UPF0276 family)
MFPSASPALAGNRQVSGAGIGWRSSHEHDLLERRPRLGFIEVHSENFFAEGGAALATLQAAREHYPVSLHGVGLALGSAAGLDPWHLDRLATLVERIEPVLVSDHASFARAATRPGAGVWHGSDLLPLAFTEAALAILVRQVEQVQERLRRPILVENLAAYVGRTEPGLAEPQFLRELSQRSGCGLLLDVNNLMVNALNDAAPDPVLQACCWIDALDGATVGEIHLAGHTVQPGLIVDDHGAAVTASVWQVYRHALRRLGPVPSLVEWDTALPAFEVLLGEAAKAEQCMAEQHMAETAERRVLGDQPAQRQASVSARSAG